MNWDRKRVWSDLQTAKFLSLIDGNHELYKCDASGAVRFINCSMKELKSILTRLKGSSYVYPLQFQDITTTVDILNSTCKMYITLMSYLMI